MLARVYAAAYRIDGGAVAAVAAVAAVPGPWRNTATLEKLPEPTRLRAQYSGKVKLEGVGGKGAPLVWNSNIRVWSKIKVEMDREE